MINGDERSGLLAETSDVSEAETRPATRQPNTGIELREDLPWGMPGRFNKLPVRRGALRSSFSIASVNTDAEAVALWIAEKAHRSVNTAQAYRREAERLMLWASEVKDKALSELMREDFLEFAAFLQNPTPKADWISSRRYPRSSPNWRPFMGPLKPSSAKQTQIIIGSLFRFLHKIGWIKANPVPDPIIAPAATSGMQGTIYVGNEGPGPLHRSLTSTQWRAVQSALDNLPCSTRRESLFSERARWLMTLFYECAPRVSEVASHGMGSIKPVKHHGRTIWVWFLMGKGKKLREVPLSREVVDAMVRFRCALGLAPYPTPLELTPLAPGFASMKADGEVEAQKLKPLTRQSLYKIVTGIAVQAAALLGSDHPEYDGLMSASTHWLRHTGLKQLADNTDDLRYVQQMAGHADIKTTMIYTSARSHELYDAIEAAKEKMKLNE